MKPIISMMPEERRSEAKTIRERLRTCSSGKAGLFYCKILIFSLILDSGCDVGEDISNDRVARSVQHSV